MRKKEITVAHNLSFPLHSEYLRVMQTPVDIVRVGRPKTASNISFYTGIVSSPIGLM